MTPLELSILLHYRGSATDYRYWPCPHCGHMNPMRSWKCANCRKEVAIGCVMDAYEQTDRQADCCDLERLG